MSKQYTETELMTLKLSKLWPIFTQVTGEVTRAPNKKFLVRRILEAQGAQDGDSGPQEPQSAGETVPTTIEAPEPEASAQGGQDAPGNAQEGPDAIAEATSTEGNPTAQLTEPDAQVAANAAPEPEEDPQALSTPADGDEGEARPQTSPLAERPLKDLTVDELRTLYVETIGRNTSSVHRGYLIWKIREARKGRISIGPTKRREAKSNADYKVLPLRMETTQVEAMDAAWKRLGYASRMAFLRDALANHLAAKGEAEAAEAMR